MLPGVTPRQRSRLFCEVNDRINELLEAAEPDLPGEFLCECGRDCGQRVELLPAAFAELRRSGDTVRSPSCRGTKFRLRLGRDRGGRSVGLETESSLGVEVVEA
jgi:hypothetical protein